MIDRILNSKQIIHKALDAATLRHDVIAQNIANADTPDYKRKDVVFEKLLQESLSQKGREKTGAEMSIPEMKIVEDHSNSSYRLDGNNVDVEVEMVEMAKNYMRYNTLAQIAGYGKIKMVLNQIK